MEFKLSTLSDDIRGSAAVRSTEVSAFERARRQDCPASTVEMSALSGDSLSDWMTAWKYTLVASIISAMASETSVCSQVGQRAYANNASNPPAVVLSSRSQTTSPGATPVSAIRNTMRPLTATLKTP